MSDSRFQKTFNIDSQLTKGAHQKRTIRPNYQQENDFFTINYKKAQPGEDALKVNEQQSAISCPWGVTAGSTSDDLNKSQNRNYGGSTRNEIPNGTEENFSRRQSENAHVVNTEMSRINQFYDHNPGYRVAQDYHKQRNLAERAKGVPWGTIDQVDTSEHDNVKRKERMPAPFATALNDEPEPGRRPVPRGQKQDNFVLSQVTF